MKKQLLLAILPCLILVFCAACGTEQSDTTLTQPTTTVDVYERTDVFPITYEQWVTDAFAQDYRPCEGYAGQIITMRTAPIADATLTLYYNGIPMEQIHAGDDYWEYQFTMPGEAVYISKVLEAELIFYEGLSLSDQEPWLSSLNASDIVSVTTVVESDHTGGMNTIWRITDSVDIASYLVACRSAALTLSEDYVLAPGTATRRTTFTLADGSTYCFETSDNYYCVNGQYYALSIWLSLNSYSTCATTYSIRTNAASVQLYDISFNFCGYYDGFADLEFVYDEPWFSSSATPSYCFKDDFGTLYIWGQSICTMNANGTITDLRLVNGDFNEIIDSVKNALRLFNYETWILDYSDLDVEKISTCSYYEGSLIPSVLATHYYTTDAAVISELWSALWHTTLYTDFEETGLPYTHKYTIEVTMKDGTVHTIETANSVYRFADWKSLIMPELGLEKYDSGVSHHYSFANAQEPYNIYDCRSEQKIGRINDLSQLIFVEVEEDLELSDTRYYITTDFGTIYIYGSQLFTFWDSNDSLVGFYQLAEDSFYSWFYSYSA